MTNTIIQIKKSTTTARPADGSLAAGEPAYSFNSDKLFVGNSSGLGVVEVGGGFYANLAIQAFNTANSGGAGLAPAFNQANQAFTTANAANGWANTVVTAANNYSAAVGAAANSYAAATYGTIGSLGSNWAVTNSVYTVANTASIVAPAAYVAANGAWGGANSALVVGNAAYAAINAAWTTANASPIANAAYASVNSAFTILNTAYTVANSSNGWTNTVGSSANSYAAATYYSKAGGIIAGDVSINGNLTITGQTAFANTTTLLIGDNLITLNAQLPASVSPYSGNSGITVNRANINGNAAIQWNETIKAWQFTSNTLGPLSILASQTDANNVGINANNYALTTFTPLTSFASGFAVTNSAYTAANIAVPAYVAANGAWGGGNSALIVANAAFAVLNIAYASANASPIANAAYAATNVAWNTANSALIVGNSAYAGSNTVYNVANQAFTVGNSAFAVLNVAYAVANASNGWANAVGTNANNYTNADNTRIFQTFADAGNLISGTIASARLSGSYTGITGVGTITAGVWNGQAVNVAYGGTGVTTFANNGILYGNTTGALNVTAAGSVGNLLQVSTAGVPVFAMLDGGSF